MGLDAALDVVLDRTDSQLAFEGTKGSFHFGKLHVLTPEGVGIHGIEIGAQQISALTQLGSPQARLVPRPQEPAAAVFNHAEHGPAFGITFFQTAKPTLDFTRVLESPALYRAAQSAQRAVQTGELTSQDSGFLFGSLQAARQDEGLCALCKKLDAHPRLSGDLLPVALKQFVLKVSELVARSAHQIKGSALPKILQVILADNAAIKHPHPTSHPVLVLDCVDDLFEGGHVGGVSIENLVSYREAFRGHNQSDNDLQSVRTMIPRVTARGTLHPLGFSFKIGAR